jgi:hypothetical protein
MGNNMNPFNVLSYVLVSAISMFVAWLLFTKKLEPKVARMNFIDTGKMTRYALRLDEKAEADLQRLAATYGLKSGADVYDLGIRLLTWMTNQQADGYKIGRRKNNIVQHLKLPEFDHDTWKAAA